MHQYQVCKYLLFWRFKSVLCFSLFLSCALCIVYCQQTISKTSFDVSILDPSLQKIFDSNLFFVTLKIRNYFEIFLDETERLSCRCPKCYKGFRLNDRLVCNSKTFDPFKNTGTIEYFSSVSWTHVKCRISEIEQSDLLENTFGKTFSISAFVHLLNEDELKYCVKAMKQKDISSHFEKYLYERLLFHDIQGNIVDENFKTCLEPVKKYTGVSSLNEFQLERLYLKFSKQEIANPLLNRLTLSLAFFEPASFKSMFVNLINAFDQSEPDVHESVLQCMKVLPGLCVDSMIPLDTRMEYALFFMELCKKVGKSYFDDKFIPKLRLLAKNVSDKPLKEKLIQALQ